MNEQNSQLEKSPTMNRDLFLPSVIVACADHCMRNKKKKARSISPCHFHESTVIYDGRLDTITHDLAFKEKPTPAVDYRFSFPTINEHPSRNRIRYLTPREKETIHDICSLLSQIISTYRHYIHYKRRRSTRLSAATVTMRQGV